MSFLCICNSSTFIQSGPDKVANLLWDISLVHVMKIILNISTITVKKFYFLIEELFL